MIDAEWIPFNRPALEGRELDYVRAAVEGGHTASSGPFSTQAAALLRDDLAAADVLLTTSCTDALEMSALLLNLAAGDIVVVPSFTFVSTALAFAREGAQLLFCDIEDETLALDPRHLAELLEVGGDRIRAVVTVHYAGVGGRIAELCELLARYPHVQLIEDNAHGLFASYRGRMLGSFGRMSTLSFHETKNFLCGEGGALVLNDAGDVDRAHVLHDKGTNRRAFMLNQVDKYSWKDTGSSFALSDVLAAYLHGQLEQKEAILTRRRLVYERYERLLAPFADELGYRTPRIPEDRQQGYHMYYVLLPDKATRDRVLAGLRDRQVQATFHYVPLDDSDGASSRRAFKTECPVTHDISGRLLRLPFYNRLSDADAERVVTGFLDELRGVRLH